MNTQDLSALSISNENYIPQDNVAYKYIELSNIAANGIIADSIVVLGKDLPSRARRRVHTSDVIISSIEGSLSSCAIVPESLNNSICTTGFYVISSGHINSETLFLLFKSCVFHLMKKGCSGTILTAINNDEFLKIPLPIIIEGVQDLIAEKLRASFSLHAESRKLLDAAKVVVEIAVEQDEAAALEYLIQYV